MSESLLLVIGGIGLPAFVVVILWAVHKAGLPAEFDQIVTFVVSLAFAGLVITLNFFPQYAQVIVGAVTFLYTMLTTLSNLLPNAVVAVFGSPEKKAQLRAKLASPSV